jgi:transposase-like protein
MGEKNRHFSREFKRDAVQLVTEKGMPVGKVARELDIHPNLLHLWRRSNHGSPKFKFTNRP